MAILMLYLELDSEKLSPTKIKKSPLTLYLEQTEFRHLETEMPLSTKWKKTF